MVGTTRVLTSIALVVIEEVLDLSVDVADGRGTPLLDDVL